MLEDFPISELRIVRLYKGDQIRSTDHYMHKSQVKTFCKAAIALHHSPGINPHTKCKTTPLKEIYVGCLRTDAVSYWWCTEDLQNNGDPKGARLNDADSRTERVWAHTDPVLRLDFVP